VITALTNGLKTFEKYSRRSCKSHTHELHREHSGLLSARRCIYISQAAIKNMGKISISKTDRPYKVYISGNCIKIAPKICKKTIETYFRWERKGGGGNWQPRSFRVGRGANMVTLVYTYYTPIKGIKHL